MKFWRTKSIMEDTKQVVSLTKIIRQYYEDKTDGHSFPDFYEYVRQQGHSLYDRLNILPEYFDIDSFLHVCSEFMPGGFYRMFADTLRWRTICRTVTLSYLS